MTAAELETAFAELRRLEADLRRRKAELKAGWARLADDLRAYAAHRARLEAAAVAALKATEAEVNVELCVGEPTLDALSVDDGDTVPDEQTRSIDELYRTKPAPARA